MEPGVLFENKSLIAVDKPAGMVVNRAETVETKTLQDWIEGNLKFPLANDRSLRNGIVHRLDKDTSGVILVAKTRKAMRDLQDQFKRREVAKKYLALVHGRLTPREGSISLPLARRIRDRERFGVSISGKKAQTTWNVREYLKKKNNTTLNEESYSYVEVSPQTGRTHQIRVHLAHVNYPIVSDARYLGKRRARADRKWCPRQFLHAWKLRFRDPLGAKKVSVKSPLASDLRKALMKLRKIEVVK